MLAGRDVDLAGRLGVEAGDILAAAPVASCHQDHGHAQQQQGPQGRPRDQHAGGSRTHCDTPFRGSSFIRQPVSSHSSHQNIYSPASPSSLRKYSRIARASSSVALTDIWVMYSASNAFATGSFCVISTGFTIMFMIHSGVRRSVMPAMAGPT